MARKLAVLFPVLLFAFVLAASADWDETEPAKWVQLPDLTSTGIDVNASYDYILADDFLCTEAGEILSVHIWGSWLYDYLPHGMDPHDVKFTLSFHADIPDSLSPTGYSMPGDVLWYREYQPGEFRARVWQSGIREGWMEPPDFYIFPADTVCWQYNFYLDGEFYQQGSPDNPIVYWLDVKAEPFDTEAWFGWKTSLDHWNDDAVWGIGYEPYLGPWYELIYPPGHELYGQSIDLAFVIVGEEQPDLDWGDAPEDATGAGYPTTSGLNGANHIIGGPWLGDNTDSPDQEPDGQPDPNALGDDNDGNDDEDGVQIPPLTPTMTSTISFTLSGMDAYVEGWIDFDGSRTWDAAEKIVDGMYATGAHAVNVITPAWAVPGQTFARFRVNGSGGPIGPVGPAQDGEVEDHEVDIEDPHTYKWFQRPDLSIMGIDVEATYPYILADDFLCTESGRITIIDIWGSWMDDYLPFGVDPEAVDFILSFHTDNPNGPGGYSEPADVEWFRDFVPGEFTASVWADSIDEGWLRPPDTYWFPADHVCWHYQFRIDPYEAFFQMGTEDEPIVYWLDVQAYPHDPDAWFGWKTSFQHWNDDAVWGQGSEPYLGPWYELRYPPGHELYGQSIDLAFRLTNDPMSGVPDRDAEPEGFGLYQNVPNPFSASTTIRYSLTAESHVKLVVYDVEGRIVGTLVDETQSGGMKTATWSGLDDSGRQMPAGIYFYRLMSGSRMATQKMLYLK
jgi:hypothetical protein